MHGLLNRFTHRCSILSRFSHGQFNANEGHRFVSYQAIAPSGEAVTVAGSRIAVERVSSLLDENDKRSDRTWLRLVGYLLELRQSGNVVPACENQPMFFALARSF
jgi:hypothetical protein